jgi:hypothetical protein
MEFKGMSMSQLIEAHNRLATEKGRPHETEFKNLAAARAAITDLENLNMNTETTETITGADVGDAALVAAAQAATSNSDASKYSTVGKRGPTQGVGEFAKDLLSKGMATGDVLNAVRAQFPTAKTSASCIAYYKAALKNPNLGKRKGSVAATDPTALRAKAAELMAQAQQAEAANAAQAVENAKKAVAAAEEAKKIAEAAVAAQEALAAQAAANAQVQPQA